MSIVTQLLKKQKHKCFFCGTHITHMSPDRDHRATLDHFVPTSRIGKKSKTHNYINNNLVAACGPCNREKQSRLPTAEEISRYKHIYGKEPTYAVGGQIKEVKEVKEPAPKEKKERKRKPLYASLPARPFYQCKANDQRAAQGLCKVGIVTSRRCTIVFEGEFVECDCPVAGN